MSLKNEITTLANDFAQGVLAAIRSASLEEIIGEGPGREAKAKPGPRRPAAAAAPVPARKQNGRLARRSEEEIGAVAEKIVALLSSHPEGLRAEQIRAELGIERKELPRPIKELVARKKIKAKGEKRATTYFVR